ncbi:hypothetical protein B0H16DRAFT_1717036 [Mycena metata]|uniref:Uncharacterized protein n=1 Tax=Mycena metata TaxID=1033252 RepID=A0AAD7JKE2_9AGAR|nr:hypothetical protein B0H16DRAFT_1717036 [Mycena metata]
MSRPMGTWAGGGKAWVALRLEHAWMVLARRVQALTVIAEHAKPFDAMDTFGDAPGDADDIFWPAADDRPRRCSNGYANWCCPEDFFT